MFFHCDLYKTRSQMGFKAKLFNTGQKYFFFIICTKPGAERALKLSSLTQTKRYLQFWPTRPQKFNTINEI